VGERAAAGLLGNGLGRNSAPTTAEDSGAASKKDGTSKNDDGAAEGSVWRVVFCRRSRRWSYGKQGESERGGEVEAGTDGKESNNGEKIEELLEPSDTPSDTNDVGRSGSFVKESESMCRGCIASSGRKAERRVVGVRCEV
jgi:hypothetical protein